jgi:hypothetical protein
VKTVQRYLCTECVTLLIINLGLKIKYVEVFRFTAFHKLSSTACSLQDTLTRFVNPMCNYGEVKWRLTFRQ